MACHILLLGFFLLLLTQFRIGSVHQLHIIDWINLGVERTILFRWYFRHSIMNYQIWTKVYSFKSTFKNSFIFCCHFYDLIDELLFECLLFFFWHDDMLLVNNYNLDIWINIKYQNAGIVFRGFLVVPPRGLRELKSFVLQGRVLWQIFLILSVDLSFLLRAIFQLFLRLYLFKELVLECLYQWKREHCFDSYLEI